jgi:hypothetical protein
MPALPGAGASSVSAAVILRRGWSATLRSPGPSFLPCSSNRTGCPLGLREVLGASSNGGGQRSGFTASLGLEARLLSLQSKDRPRHEPSDDRVCAVVRARPVVVL